MQIKDNGEWGVKYLNFNDSQGNECILEDSIEVSPSKAIIRFGRSEKQMHLSKDDVKTLIPYLEKFVKTGNL